ncbi:MAG: penicillin-binding protein 2 [Micromonosporaceae bacterium]|nr:penicillin-binding protein 2 [Micromonosporaceae bacterium]
MNAPLRRIGILVMVLFGLLFANLNWVQAYKADEYRTSEYNTGRVQVAEYRRERGPILVGRDAIVAAVSEETDGRLRFRRTYPEEERWAHVVGYKPVLIGPAGLEQAENDFLAGNADQFFVDRIWDLFGGPSVGGTIQTTLSRPAQQTAYELLRDATDKGAVVALDPRTGAVQAMVSAPSFDPNPLASHDTGAAAAAYAELSEDEDKPLLNRAVSERFPPGSVFKVIDTAAALQAGMGPDTELVGGAEYTPETGGPIGNAPGVVCPGEITLEQSLVVSCNTAFSRLAAEELGAAALQESAAGFGFGDDELTVGRPDGGGIPVATSVTGDLQREDGQDDPPTVAQSAIGQASVAMTPLQGALLAATVANGGVQMQPYLVEQLQDADLRPVYRAEPAELRRPLPAEAAETLRDMMVGVVTGGTGGNAAISGAVVGGKTGTAETGGDGADHGWFVGFAIVDGEPVSAVAVLLENAGSGGSSEAARIAGQVLQAAIGDQGSG